MLATVVYKKEKLIIAVSGGAIRLMKILLGVRCDHPSEKPEISMKANVFINQWVKQCGSEVFAESYAWWMIQHLSK